MWLKIYRGFLKCVPKILYKTKGTNNIYIFTNLKEKSEKLSQREGHMINLIQILIDAPTKAGMTQAFKLKDAKEVPGVGPTTLLLVSLVGLIFQLHLWKNCHLAKYCVANFFLLHLCVAFQVQFCYFTIGLFLEICFANFSTFLMWDIWWTTLSRWGTIIITGCTGFCRRLLFDF